MTRDNSPLAGRMIFALGQRRSGTNWLQRMLGSHPDVAAVPGESFFFSHGIRPLTERIHHGAAGSPMTTFTFMELDALLDALRDFCDRCSSACSRSWATAPRTWWSAHPLTCTTSI